MKKPEMLKEIKQYLRKKKIKKIRKTKKKI